MNAIEVKNLCFTYPQTDERAIDGVSFAIEKGDFTAVCGATGSGKSTLIRMLKRELTPNGRASGEIRISGRPIGELTPRESACIVGYVMQRPEQQTVTDRVWHELAFGLENLGLPTDVIRRRVSEIASYFGIEEWFEQSVSELSGGQKQLLNLAAVMVMQPDILLLDEPTAQLDPIAASDFITTVSKLNRELSLTVIMIEHRLEDVIPISNKLLALEGGRLFAFGETRETVSKLRNSAEMLEAMPSAVRLFSVPGVAGEGAKCPLDVREGRAFIEGSFKNEVKSLGSEETSERDREEKPVLRFDEVFFRYSRELPDVLRGLSFEVFEKEIFSILGGNGSGKSTALSVCAGLYKPYSGSVRVFGKKLSDYRGQSLYRDCLAMLPQDVQTVFLRNTVREELADAKADPEELPFDLTPLYPRHPYDLSGGQQQLVALAKLLAARPKIILLDEPTKGLDAHTKAEFIRLLKKLREKGMTIVAVTHDVEFAAACADRCALFFAGEITSCDFPRRFFSMNSFYTTAANRMTRGYYDDVISVDDAAQLCLANGRKS